MAKSIWFRKFKKEVESYSPHIRFKRLRMGFYRIYFQEAYIMECFSEMPHHGYTIEEYDPRLESRSYYEEYEDQLDLVRKIKNFKEGLYDSLDRFKTRMYLFRTDKEFNERAKNAYKQFIIK